MQVSDGAGGGDSFQGRFIPSLPLWPDPYRKGLPLSSSRGVCTMHPPFTPHFTNAPEDDASPVLTLPPSADRLTLLCLSICMQLRVPSNLHCQVHPRVNLGFLRTLAAPLEKWECLDTPKGLPSPTGCKWPLWKQPMADPLHDLQLLPPTVRLSSAQGRTCQPLTATEPPAHPPRCPTRTPMSCPEATWRWDSGLRGR